MLEFKKQFQFGFEVREIDNINVVAGSPIINVLFFKYLIINFAFLRLSISINKRSEESK
jgi:hypothetical protein